MKKVPIEILTSWAKKFNISIEQLKEIFKKYLSLIYMIINLRIFTHIFMKK